MISLFLWQTQLPHAWNATQIYWHVIWSSFKERKTLRTGRGKNTCNSLPFESFWLLCNIDFKRPLDCGRIVVTSHEKIKFKSRRRKSWVTTRMNWTNNLSSHYKLIPNAKSKRKSHKIKEGKKDKTLLHQMKPKPRCWFTTEQKESTRWR
jgi:hypothetical protein